MAADLHALQGAKRLDSKLFLRDFFAASVVCGIFIGWFFHAPLSSRQAAFGLPTAEAVKYTPEIHYQTFPAHAVVSRLIRQGIFPTWTSYAQGGTPLIGKMGPGVFSPFALPYYLFSRCPPHLIAMGTAALKFYFAFAFLYLFARLVKVGWFGSVVGALAFIASYGFHIFIVYGLTASALCVPLLLLLSELYFHERCALSLLLLPWACALSFFGGHMEVAFLANLTAAIYFIARLWGSAAPASRSKWGDISAFAAAMLGGACISGFFLLAGREYVSQSYTAVWRTLPSYGWHYHTIAKHLTWDDFTVAFWGLAAAGLSLWFLKRLPKAWQEGSPQARLGSFILTSAALGAALAFLANLGFDLSFFMVGTHAQDGSLVFWAADMLLLCLALWAWGTSKSAPLRILGWFMLSILLVRLKLPPLTNGMVQLPFFRNFNNNDYHYAYDAAAGVLCGAAYDRLRLLFGEDRLQRRKAASLAFGFLGVFVAAIALARPFEGIVARNFPTGLNPLDPGRPSGGIMGPERVRTFSRSRTVTGWIAGYPPASSIQVGSLENGRLVGGVEARRQLPCSSGRCYFSAEAPVGKTLAAIVTYATGRQRTLHGPVVTALRRGPGRWGEAALAGIIMLFVLVFWLPPRLLGILYLGLIAAWCWPASVTASPADGASYSLPGTATIKEDPGLFRVSGFDLEFLRADFLNMHGLSDFRTGGDNLDVYGMIEFSKLCYSFLANRADAKTTGFGLRLMGLANVRYLLGASADSVEHPDLQPVYQDRDMRIYRNRQALPRAVYFEQQAFVPLKIKDLQNPGVENQILGGIAGAILQGRLDPARTLLLNDPPASIAAGAAPELSSAASVAVREYGADRVLLEVDAPRPGFVFLSDNHFPGWRATVNGRPADILRSWITFRAVQVPGGRSVVDFRYRPAFAGLPLLVSVLSCGTWLFLFLRRRDDPANAAARKLAPKAAATPEAAECARIAQRLCLGLVAPVFVFWLLWGSFVYRGIGVNWAARLFLAGGFVLLLARQHVFSKGSVFTRRGTSVEGP